MIINLRGTNASGKTTVSRRLIDENNGRGVVEPPTVLGKNFKKPNAFIIGDLVIVGRYQSGCDGILPHEVIEEMMAYWTARMPHLVWENVLVSGNLGRWAQMACNHITAGYHPVWAYMDTPAKVCLERVMTRRSEARAAGFKHRQKDEDVKLDIITSMWRRVRKTAVGALELGIDVRWLDHMFAYEQVHDLLLKGGWTGSATGEPLLPATTATYPAMWRPTVEEVTRLGETCLLPWEPDGTFNAATEPKVRAVRSQPTVATTTSDATDGDTFDDIGDAFDL